MAAATTTAVAPLSAPAVSREPAPKARPSLGRVILIQTPDPINGQREHAAMITQVLADEAINAMVMPGSGLPYPVGGIRYESDVAPGALCWRWPPKL